MTVKMIKKNMRPNTVTTLVLALLTLSLLSVGCSKKGRKVPLSGKKVGTPLKGSQGSDSHDNSDGVKKPSIVNDTKETADHIKATDLVNTIEAYNDIQSENSQLIIFNGEVDSGQYQLEQVRVFIDDNKEKNIIHYALHIDNANITQSRFSDRKQALNNKSSQFSKTHLSQYVLPVQINYDKEKHLLETQEELLNISMDFTQKLDEKKLTLLNEESIKMNSYRILNIYDLINTHLSENEQGLKSGVKNIEYSYTQNTKNTDGNSLAEKDLKTDGVSLYFVAKGDHRFSIQVEIKMSENLKETYHLFFKAMP